MIGSTILTIALVLSVFSMTMYYFSYKGAANAIKLARLSYHGMAMMVILASTFLLYIILTHQYQYGYVYSYSNGELSTGLLLSTFWAGQEGSFMLWLLMTSIIGIMLQSYTAKRGDDESSVMLFFTLATSFLLMMVSPLMKNPFAMIWSEEMLVDVKNISQNFLGLPFLQNSAFSMNGGTFIKISTDVVQGLKEAGVSLDQFIIDGKGLNPLLQNFWMQIHPPILFAGFAMSTVPFAFAMSALLRNEYKDWVRQSLPWILGVGGVLGLGIMLGGYWAYGVLGWGGYWAWDPVENSSLVPWLVSVSGLHTMLVQRRTQKKTGGLGKYVKTNLILAILTYVLVVYSTFLTRSGILGDASVHSFVDPGKLVYAFLVLFFGTFVVLGFAMIVYRWKHLSEVIESEEGALSRDLSLFTAAVVVGASALIVVVGTSAPLFGRSVEPSFYNEMHVPLAIILGILNGLSLLVKWNYTKGEELLQRSKLSVIVTLAATIAVVLVGGVYNVMMILMTLSAIFTIVVNGEVCISIIKGNMQMIGAYVAHIGLALLILGVVGSAGYSQEQQLELHKGVPVKIFGYELTFTGYKPIENNKKFAFEVVAKKGNSISKLSPVMYTSNVNQSMMREPDILVKPTQDLYISPLGYSDGSENTAGEKTTFNVGETKEVSGVSVKYVEFIKPDMAAMQASGDFKMGAKLEVSKDGKKIDTEALLVVQKGEQSFPPVSIKEFGVSLRLGEINPGSKSADIIIMDANHSHAQKKSEVLSAQVSIKPFVNLVWIGVLIVTIGFFIALARRLKEAQAS